jgi:hypothetical protein
MAESTVRRAARRVVLAIRASRGKRGEREVMGC